MGSDIVAELDKLKARTQPICALADLKIAHSVGEPRAVPKYSDVDDASEYIATSVRDTSRFSTGSGPFALLPVCHACTTPSVGRR